MDADDFSLFLVRAVLDPEFRRLVRETPDEAFAGYALTDEQQAAIRSGDGGMLRLLGTVIRADDVSSPPWVSAPDPDADAPATAIDVPVPLAPIALQVVVQPWAQQTPEGLRLSFTSSVQHSAAPATTAADAAPPTPRRDWSAWDHDTGSEEARAAARAVQDAPAGERRARILALLRTVAGAERPGAAEVQDDG